MKQSLKTKYERLIKTIKAFDHPPGTAIWVNGEINKNIEKQLASIVKQARMIAIIESVPENDG